MTLDNSVFSVEVIEMQIYSQAKNLLDRSGIRKLGALEKFLQ